MVGMLVNLTWANPPLDSPNACPPSLAVVCYIKHSLSQSRVGSKYLNTELITDTLDFEWGWEILLTSFFGKNMINIRKYDWIWLRYSYSRRSGRWENIIQVHNNVMWDWVYSTQYFEDHYQFHITLLWIWIMLWS